MNSKKLRKELKRVAPELRDLFRAVREMNTFVCEICHDEELNTHPSLGDDWNFEWYVAMAELARERGWKTKPPVAKRDQWLFDDFQVVGPQCEAGLT